MTNVINPQLIEASNSKGYVVRSIGTWNPTQFGESNIVTIEGGQYRITFITNVLHGVNYFKIFQVHDLINNRAYRASRYHIKFINLICEINGETYVNIKEENN